MAENGKVAKIGAPPDAANMWKPLSQMRLPYALLRHVAGERIRRVHDQFGLGFGLVGPFPKVNARQVRSVGVADVPRLVASVTPPAVRELAGFIIRFTAVSPASIQEPLGGRIRQVVLLSPNELLDFEAVP